jgi:hypothetical protein
LNVIFEKVDAQSFVCLLLFICPKCGVPNLVHIATRNKKGGMLRKRMMGPLRSKYMPNIFSQVLSREKILGAYW